MHILPEAELKRDGGNGVPTSVMSVFASLLSELIEAKVNMIKWAANLKLA